MLAISGILLLFLAFGVFWWTLARGIYHRRPYELFVPVGASALLGLGAVLERPTLVPMGLFAVELAALALLSWYMSVGARFSRGKLRVSVGDRFPDFALRSSRGELVESRGILGKTALYLFYRGPW